MIPGAALFYQFKEVVVGGTIINNGTSILALELITVKVNNKNLMVKGPVGVHYMYWVEYLATLNGALFYCLVVILCGDVRSISRPIRGYHCAREFNH